MCRKKRDVTTKQEKRARFVKTRYRKLKDYYRPMPTTQKEQDELAVQMFEWMMKHTDDHSLNNFSVHTKIPICDFKAIATMNAKFKRLMDLCYQMISERLEKGWREGKYDSKYASRFLRIYNEEYKTSVDERFLLQKQSAANFEAGIEVVEIPNWENAQA